MEEESDTKEAVALSEAEDDVAEASESLVDRKAILRRRNRFIAMALSGMATAGLNSCSEAPDLPEVVDAGVDTGTPQPCLSAPWGEDAAVEDAGVMDASVSDAGASDAGHLDAGVDGGVPMPCLSPPRPRMDAGADAAASPMPCLSVMPPSDAGADASDDARVREAGLPLPCLSIRPLDAGSDAGEDEDDE